MAEGEAQWSYRSGHHKRCHMSGMAKSKRSHQFTSTTWSHLPTVGFEHSCDEQTPRRISFFLNSSSELKSLVWLACLTSCLNSQGASPLHPVSWSVVVRPYLEYCVCTGVRRGHILRSLANRWEQNYELCLNPLVKRLKELRVSCAKRKEWGMGTQFWPLSAGLWGTDDMESEFNLFFATLENSVTSV